jgi:very-short-patch-repair endonuclease
MKDVLRREAAKREGVVSAWVLLEAGMSRHAIAHHTAGLRRIHDGVWVTGDAPIARRQLWWAAVLTTPASVLSHASAGAAWGFRPWDGAFEVITRPGNGGPRRFGQLLVCRAKHVDSTVLNGLPITTPEQTLAQPWPKLNDRERRKMLREALRLRTTTTARVATRAGRPSMRQVSQRYARLQLHRCRSDAEAHATELIDQAGLPLPHINVRRAGEEADLSWEDRRLIIEIDGDQFHQDKREDARRTAVWEHAGWRVRRAPSDLVFNDSRRFVEGVRRHLADP